MAIRADAPNARFRWAPYRAGHDASSLEVPLLGLCWPPLPRQSTITYVEELGKGRRQARYRTETPLSIGPEL
jgi:hypothetical protein